MALGAVAHFKCLHDSAAPVVVYEVLRQWGCMDPQQADKQQREQAAEGGDGTEA